MYMYIVHVCMVIFITVYFCVSTMRMHTAAGIVSMSQHGLTGLIRDIHVLGRGEVETKLSHAPTLHLL